MKTLKILLLLLVLFPFSNIFSQYFIDHDTVERVWRQNNLERYWAKPEEIKDRTVYLKYIRKGWTNSDVKIGFDKLDYKSGDIIKVTLIRGYANEADSVMVIPPGYVDALDNQVEVKQSELDQYYLYLKKGEEVEINLSLNDGKGQSLTFSFGGVHFEARSYVILYSDKLQEGEFGDSVKPTGNTLIIQGVQEFRQIAIPDTSGLARSPGMIDSKQSFSYLEGNATEIAEINAASSHQISLISPNDFSPVQNVTIHGTMDYDSPIFPNNNYPVNYWVLRLYESDNSSDLDVIDEFDPYTEHSVSSGPGDGTYSVDINITKGYFRLGLILTRKSGAHNVYELGRWELRQGVPTLVGYQLLAQTLPNVYTQVNFDYTYAGSPTNGVIETLRRCAHIGNRIDYSILTNVGGDDLAAIQSILIATRDNDAVMPAGSGSLIIDEVNKITAILIAPDEDIDYYDAVIIHEHGHTLMFTLTNYEWREAGNHYLDQKNRPGMAFSEGWASYWACTVANNSTLYSQTPYAFYQLDVNTVTRNYIYSRTALHAIIYLPDGITIYDGVECEATVAGALWKLTSSNSLSSVWNGLKSQISDGTQNRAVKNMMGYFAANTSLKNSFYSNPSGAEDMGFGRNLSFLTNTTNLQITIPGLSDKTLIYLQGGTYIVNPQIQVDAKSFGIFGMSPKNTILIGQANQNTINVINANPSDNWFKISDIQFQNGGFAVDAGATGTDQPKLYMSRCISISNLRGVCFAGDAIIVNNFIIDNQDFGIFLISAGAPRTLYIYNNIIRNSGTGLRFYNQVTVSGYVVNNMFVDNDNGIATVHPNALPNSRSGIYFQYNGQHPDAITTEAGLTVSNNYTEIPAFLVDNYQCTVNYWDSGILVGTLNDFDPIFYDITTEGFYGTERNWIGAYGGRQAHFLRSPLLPTSSTLITNPPASISGQNVWAGQVNITSTTTILQGASVTIIPGTNITFANNSSLIVNGTLNA
ncbi:MAG: hypothetical protein IIC76_06710 [Bacteroidetes bacterium]|nr:hypothetical protein [Bacteroidota bacterium]